MSDVTETGTWARMRARQPDPAAIAIVADGLTLTYGDLDLRVARASAWLRNRGLRPGDRLALMAPRSLAFLDVFLGALATGVVVVPMNDRYTADEVRYLLADSAPALAILVDDLAPAHGAVPASELRSLLDDPRIQPTTVETGPAASDTAAILYTSGTTGRPKGAVILHENLQATLASLHVAWEWTADDVLVHALPLNHVHGLVVAQLGALWAGSRTIWLSRFEPALLWDAVAAHRATIFMGVPTFYTRLLAAPGMPDLASIRLFTCGSAPLPAHVLQAFHERFGHVVLERYGMTEIGMALSNPYRGERRAGSVGLPLPGVDARITAPDGSVLDPGEIGEVRVRGPAVFAGYRNRPDATDEAIGDGWMHTGDLGFRDHDGYFHLTGRATELILVGGLNVYPREVESALLDHPAVADCAVTGLSDPDLGEIPVAAIVLREPASIPDLRAFARERVASYKVPRQLLIVGELPRNTMGKVLKAELRRLFVTVRPARPDEAAAIADRNVAMARETEDLALDPAVALSGAQAVFRGDVGAFYLIAEIGGAPVGQLMLTTEWSDWRSRPVWWIQSVYVGPEHRRAGVFRALHDDAIRRARDAGAGGVRLYVDRRNTAAIDTYRRLGMDGEHYLVFERMF